MKHQLSASISLPTQIHYLQKIIERPKLQCSTKLGISFKALSFLYAESLYYGANSGHNLAYIYIRR